MSLRLQIGNPEGARSRFLLISGVELGFAILGHLAFAMQWPRFWRIFEVAAILSVPLFLCMGVIILLQRQRSWQVIVGVGLSAVACAIVGVTVYHLINGLYWA